MLAERGFCLTVAVLVVCVTGCENHDSVGPGSVAARQTSSPSGANARPINSSTVQVTWIDGVSNEIGFRIERSATSTGPWATAGATGPNVTSFDDVSRASEQQVCYRVFATLRNGQSNASNTSCTVPPAATTDLTATAVDQQAIDLAWADNSAVEEGFEIERATAVGGPYNAVAFLAANTTAYRQSGLTTNTTYWYRVRANNDGGYGDYSNIASATPVFMAPKAPSATNVIPTSSVTAFITWVDNSANENGFHVQRSTDLGATWNTYYTPPANRTSASDYALAIEQQVCYRVMAYNAQGDSPPSPTDCTIPPAGPTDLTVVAVDPQTTDLGWTDNSTVEDGYEVQRADGTTEYGVVAQLAANSTSYHDVSAAGAVTYRVRATKDGGGSNFSNVVSTVRPSAPGGVAAMPEWSSSAVGITWTDNSMNENGFRVERSTNGGGTWVTAGTTAANPPYLYWPNKFIEGAASEQEVCYRIIAFNNVGESPPSNTGCTAPPLGATNLAATQVPEGVLLTWTDNSTVEDGFAIMLMTVCPEQADYWLYSVPADSTAFLLTDVAPWNWCGDYPTAYIIVTKDGGYADFSNGAWTGPPGTVPNALPSPTRPRAILREGP